MKKYRVHAQPIVVEACNKFEAKAKAVHIVLDDDSLLLVEEAREDETLTPIPDAFRSI